MSIIFILAVENESQNYDLIDCLALCSSQVSSLKCLVGAGVAAA